MWIPIIVSILPNKISSHYLSEELGVSIWEVLIDMFGTVYF